MPWHRLWVLVLLCARSGCQGEVMAGVQDAVEAVVSILGMSPCDGTDAVPPNARSHTVLLSGEPFSTLRHAVLWS